MNKAWKRDLLIILAVSLPFIFWGIGSISLLDPDEGMYGAIAREMAEKGDWITPRFNGVRYLEKPPLYFWLTAIANELFGPSEWTTRLWSALPTFGTAILIWRIGSLLYGGPAGLLSAIILVTSVGAFRYARVAATDSLLVFSLALAVYGFVKTMLERVSVSGRQSLGPFLFYLGLAFGVLSKGLVGALLPLLIVGLYLCLSGERIPLKQLHLRWGLALFVALTLPWHMLADWRNPGFFEFYIVDNQFLRFLSRRAFIEDDVPVTTVAFIGLTFIWLFPWSLFLGATLRHGFSNPRSVSTAAERLHLLVGLWVLTVIGFFALSSSKLEHYVLPALAPLSLMVGALWSEAFRTAEPLPTLKWVFAASAVGCSVVGFALVYFGEHLTPQAVFSWLAEINVYYRILRERGAPFPFPSVTPFVPLATGLGAVLGIGVPLSFLLFSLGRPQASFLTVMGIAGVTAVLVFRLLLIIEPHHSTKSLALALKAVARPQEPIIHEGALEYSGGLPFYTGRQIYVLNGQYGDLDFGSHYPEGQRLFLDDVEFDRRWKGDERIFLVTPLRERESALRRLSEKAFLLGRYGSRSLYSNHEP